MPWRRKEISSHDIDYVEYVGPGLTWGRILITCVLSMWSNDIRCKYMFMFPLKNLARKGLIFVRRRHENMSPFTGRRVNAIYEETASWHMQDLLVEKKKDYFDIVSDLYH